MRNETARLSKVALVLVSLGWITGCGSVVVFESTTAINVEGEFTPPKPKIQRVEPAKRVRVTDKKIEITEKIQFEVNKAVIKSESFELLGEIAKTMQEHPEIKKVAIEGHASSEGNAQQNLTLSDARAKAVMEYISLKGGVDKGRMTAQGFGDKKPISDNNTEEGRIANRRVEFNIVERATDTSPKK